MFCQVLKYSAFNNLPLSFSFSWYLINLTWFAGGYDCIEADGGAWSQGTGDTYGIYIYIFLFFSFYGFF